MLILGARFFILLGFLLRLLVAIWNSFYGPSFGAESDAFAFHLAAIEYARDLTLDGIGLGWIYSNALGIAYYLTGESLFIGSLLSCVSWVVSAEILRSSLIILSINRGAQANAMLLYALLPSSVMFTAVTLREPYQLLFVNLAIYAVLKIYLHKSTRHWGTLIFSIVGAGALHGGLLALGVFLFAGALLLVIMRARGRNSWMRLSAMGVVVAIVLWCGVILFSNIAYDLNKGVANAVATYQNNLIVINARTQYKSAVELYSIGETVEFVLIGLFQYLFEPFPWNITSVSDSVVLFENMLRFLLIWRAATSWRVACAPQRRVLLFFMLSYFVMETIWSLGTVNWGTAVRHHLPTWGLLLLAAYARSSQRVNRIQQSCCIDLTKGFQRKRIRE